MTLTPADATSPQRLHRRGRRRVVAALLALLVVTLVSGAWWASNLGYVSWTGEACTAEGFDPIPSYEKLVTDYDKSPYCARLVRGETWF